MITVLGAGAVGLALGARLARSGLAVRMVARRAEAAARLVQAGIRAEDLAGGGAPCSVRVEATTRLDAGRITPPLLLCVRVPDVGALLPALAAAPALAVACFQNDLETEPQLASRLETVIGAVWRQTCTRVDDAHVRFAGAGRVVVGLHPEGGHPLVERLAGWLRGAGFDVGVSGRIGDDKWLKLGVNLMSAPNALVRRQDHTGAAFVEIKARVLAEAVEVFRGAGIAARSCDGRDRSLEAEIAFQRAALAEGTSTRPLPLYNQVWSALRSGGPLEADAYHRRIVEMAVQQQRAAPANARVLRFLLEARDRALGPECFSAEELLGP